MVPVLKRIRGQYSKILELWYNPEIMIGLQGFGAQDLASYSMEISKWKELVLEEMTELAGNRGLHRKIVDFVNSL